MTSFYDIMHDRVDVEPLGLSEKTTCPISFAEKLKKEQISGATKRY